MPWYNDLRPLSDDHKQSFGQLFPDLTNEDRIRIIENLLRLRLHMDANIPVKEADKSLLIASWNIKEFGHYSNRLPESYYYIAEILSRFDLIALQEIKGSLKDLLIVMRLLGKDWSYMVNDITGGAAGNSESFAYVFNTNRVEPSGLAGEIVLWEEISNNLSIKQLMRTPYITGFKAGWKSFAIINIHLKPNDDTYDKQIRKDEVKALAEIVEERIKSKTMWTENLMIMGDFNIYHSDQDIVEILTDKGFFQLQHLIDKPTNAVGTQAYDKIFYHKNQYFDLAAPLNSRAGDVFNYFEAIYRADDDWEDYKDFMLLHKGDPSTLTSDSKFKSYFKNHWRPRQISDHLPVWITMQIDSSDDFLKEKLEENKDEV